jgi:hypothetical protein
MLVWHTSQVDTERSGIGLSDGLSDFVLHWALMRLALGGEGALA